MIQASEHDSSLDFGPIDYGDKYTYFRGADLLDEDGQSVRVLPLGGALHVRMLVEAEKPIEYPTIVLCVDNLQGENILKVKSPRSKTAIPRLAGVCDINCKIDSLPLSPGEYSISLSFRKGGDYLEDVQSGIRFTVRDADTFGDGWGASKSGLCVAPSKWSLKAGRSLHRSVASGS